MNSSKPTWLALMILALVAGLLSAAPAAAAPCVTVTPDGTRRCYSTIQAAVDAAPNGATINISPGTYVEQINIRNKTLTIYGNGATVRVPSTTQVNVTYGELSERAIIGVSYSTVDIRNLVVDGANALEAHPQLIGIAFDHSSGSVKETTVKNIGFGQPRPPRVSGYPEGSGIEVGVSEHDTFGGPYTVTLAGNTITGYNSYGIVIHGGWEGPEPGSQFRAIVRNNRVVGSGPNSQSMQTGIRFFGNGRVEQNTVSNHVFTGTIHSITETCGIDVTAFSDNQVIANTLSNNEVGICVDSYFNDQFTTALLDGNRISGPAAGASGYSGVWLTLRDGNGVDLRNTVFSNLATAIRTRPTVTLNQSGNTFTGVTTRLVVEE